MDTENQNKYISVMYKLYTDGQDGKAELIEETAEGDPFIFVSALGMTLDAFEAQIVPLNAGEEFDFTLVPDDAYGDYDEAGKQALPRNVFEINGKLDSRFIFEGVFMIYELSTFIEGLGGVEQAQDALKWFRKEVKKAGFPDLELQFTMWAPQFNYSGFDAVSLTVFHTMEQLRVL